MGDFSFLDSQPPLRRNTTNSRQQQQQQQQSRGAPAHAAAGAASNSAAAAAGASGSGPKQQQQPRARIQLPSFRQVQAAEAASRPVNTFRPGATRSTQQQQQQRPQQPPAWLQQQPQQQQQPAARQQQQQGQAPGVASSSAGGGGVTAAAAAPPPQQQQPAAAAGQQHPPAWMSSLPSMTLNTQLPRFSQTAGGATTGAAVGIARPTIPLPQPAAAAAAAGGSSQQPPQQQQQVPINAVLVSRRQQGNPVLKHIRAVRWVFADIVPDYLCGQNTAVLFLSLRYHLLQPEYVLSRLQSLQRVYRLAVLLLLVDAEEVVKPLLELHKASLGAHATLVCAWSNEECARYIETFKAYENRPASSIMEHTDTDYMGRLASALTTIRGVNRSDAYSLARHFGSLADVFMCDDVQGFASIPGLGPVKAKRLLDTFHMPFKRNAGSSLPVGPAAAAAAHTGGSTTPAAAAAAGAAGAAGAQQAAAVQQQQAGAGGGEGVAEAEAEAADMDTDVGEEELQLLDSLEGRTTATTAAAAQGGGAGSSAAAAAAAGAAAVGEDGEGEDDADVADEDGEGGEEGDEGEPGLLTGDDEGLLPPLGGFHEDYLDGLDDAFDDAEEF